MHCPFFSVLCSLGPVSLTIIVICMSYVVFFAVVCFIPASV